MSTANTCVIALDAGTTGVRSRAVFTDDTTTASYREFTQHYPQPGWVEHDVDEIWEQMAATLRDVVAAVTARGASIAAIGITNQRETVVAWSRRTGRPYGTAIVWQDRRTAARCAELAADGALPLVRERTGLVLDPYFSASKVEWLLANRDIPVDDDLAIGTIDTWLLWKLTGGAVLATDPSNASRTMLYDIVERSWSPQLCELFGVPLSALGEVRPSSGRFGTTSGIEGVPDGIPISGVAGDQQAALFGQACFEPGMAKNTYGTGSFVLMNVGASCPPPTDGMLTTVAWTLADGTTAYALEGAIFVTGAAIQWLRDGLGLIRTADEIGPLAASVPDNGGVYLVPAFTGLGCPWWDPYARGSLIGITRGTTRAHVARATVEAMAYQTRDAVTAMTQASGTQLRELRVDGGASIMDLLLEFQAEQLGVTVRRPIDQETTALGAAFLAGLAEGVWPSLEVISQRWALDAEFSPSGGDATLVADLLHDQWRRAVERSRDWIEHEQPGAAPSADG
jgi:glycerol kinase